MAKKRNNVLDEGLELSVGEKMETLARSATYNLSDNNQDFVLYSMQKAHNANMTFLNTTIITTDYGTIEDTRLKYEENEQLIQAFVKAYKEDRHNQ